MHFFHPIQQCAQQVYHTAIPLSPTSSYLQNTYVQNVVDNQLPHVTAFVGAPSTWGLLLRTIDTRPRELTCITTSGQGIIAACEDIVNIYDAITGVLQQSLSPSEAVTKIQASPDGSTLFFAHSSSITMWDVQTGGLVHTFTTQSEVNNIAVSASEGHIAYSSSEGFIELWNIRTKEEGKHHGNGQPVVNICWFSPQKLAVATQNSFYIHDIAAGKTIHNFSIPDCLWGMVYSKERDEFMVGTSRPGGQADREQCSLETISHRYPGPLDKRRSTENRGRLVRQKLCRGKQSPVHLGELTRPTLVDKDVACITPPMGVQSFNTSSYVWTYNPPLLDAATSVAVSLNRNLVAQTKDSIKIFSTDVLASGEARSDTRVSHIYPLGEGYIICVTQPTRHITILGSETLREVRRDDKTLPFWSLLTKSIPALSGLVDTFDIPKAMRAWWLDTSLHEQIRLPDEDTPRLLYGLSPAYTRIATVYIPSRQDLWINDATRGSLIARRPFEDEDLGSGEIYDIIFDSEAKFHLKIDGPRQHIQIPFDITASGPSSLLTITKGEPMPLSEPWATPPYTLDENCEWVLDTQSRKICWISPGNLRRGNGGHFWAGLSLVMVGDDGVVRKVSFKKPDF
jgi:WD40 repeat protein